MHRRRHRGRCRPGAVHGLRAPAHPEGRRGHHRRDLRPAYLLRVEPRRARAAGRIYRHADRAVRRGLLHARREGTFMSLFERWLTLWVALCILAGLVLGSLAPGLFGALAALEVASVNLVVAVLIWAMVYPMMIAVDLGSLKAVGQRPKGLVITLA